MLAARFAVLAFAAIQSSVITLTNALFDIAASRDCEAVLASMRDEVVQATTTTPTSTSTCVAASDVTATTMKKTDKAKPAWSKAALARMPRVDSALRESLRLHGFVERGVVKMVVAPAGIALPDCNNISSSGSGGGSGGGGRLVIPCGTKVGVSGYSIHRDEANYAGAAGYDAFRFVKRDGEGEKEKGPRGLVNTSERFLGFSHGSHAW